MKLCHCSNPVFAKGLCKRHWRAMYAKPISHTPKPISKQSKNQKKRSSAYFRKVKTWKEQNPVCKANLPGCTIKATECHHMQGRIGKNLLDESKWLPVCHSCHSWITEHSKEAIEMGLSLSRNKVLLVSVIPEGLLISQA